MPEVDRTPPDEFVSQARDALTHLYDLAHLESHPLRRLVQSPGVGQSVGRELRRILVSAIEQLRPDDTVPHSDRSWRPHLILMQRYVDGYTPSETMADLHISLRQMQRDHRKGLLAVASLLWRQAANVRPSAAGAPEGALRQAMDTMGVHFESIDVSDLVRESIGAMRALAQTRGTQLVVTAPSMPMCVQADPALVRPGLLSLVSAIISTQPERLELSWAPQESAAEMTLALRPQPSVTHVACRQALDRLSAAKSLALAQGGEVQVDIIHGHLHQVRLRLPRAWGKRILIIDDNDRMLQLFERYLTSEGIGSIGVNSVAAAREMLDKECPSLIILDVMMRDVDGWQFLQELRSQDLLGAVPIIICSVLDEPELTEALGAQFLLKKPVTRQQMLEAVQRVLAECSRVGLPGAAH